MKNEVLLPLLAEGRKKKWAYTSLLFSLFYFTPLFFGATKDTSQYVIIGTCYLVFVAFYVVTVNTPKKLIPVLLVCLFLINNAASVFNVGGAILFGYMSFVVGYYYRPAVSISVTSGVMLSILALQHFMYPGQWLFLLACLLNCCALLGFGFMERRETTHLIKDTQAKEALGTLSAIAERERIGRDLHDIAGHALSGISLKAQVADKLMEKGKYEQARSEVKELATLSQNLLSEIRKTVTGIKHLSMEDEIEKSLAQLRDKQFIIEKSIDTNVLTSLNAVQETNLTLIMKECMTNILRHCNGNLVSITVAQENDTASMVIQDNGIVATNDTNSAIVKGNGTTGIEERAAILGAKVDFTIDKGVCVSVIFPLLVSQNNTSKEAE
ncbi:sensor histidine kinase [Agaribacter marinus]|uniref:Two-component sensor histidine kinase n=1 Tax=Agaribacter marinus TaxID=1431249 RepID=A0AA37T401_9ALTE|nr:histidine kinase [Agaribacter marinus]GLR71693.1 two-component sensor histidine kinase [Agaribacter marinus]